MSSTDNKEEINRVDKCIRYYPLSTAKPEVVHRRKKVLSPMATLLWLKETVLLPLQTNLVFTLSATVLLLLLVLNNLFKNRNRSKRKLNLPPKPSKLPIIGNLHQLGDLPHLSLQDLSKKLGHIIYLKLGEIPTVVVSSARLAKEVMKTHDLDLASRPRLFSAKYLFYNCTDMAFSPYGAYWRHIRKICIHELLSLKRVQSYSSIREDEAARLIKCIEEDSCSGTTTDLSKMLGIYANEVVCRSALGRGFSEGGEYDMHEFQRLLQESQVLLGGFSIGDYFPSKEWIHTVTGMKSRLVKTSQSFDRFLNDVIKEHQNPNREKEEHKDLVDVLLEIQKDGSLEMALTMDNIKAVILDMFTAGTDTTFITLDWGMTELIMNLKAMDKAQNEVRSIVGERRTVLESDLHQMHYLKAVIKEIFRMHPPVPLLVPRESTEDVIIDGYDIPAKTRIFVNAWAIGRDPESWKNPETFEPERFMGSSVDFKGQDYELIPFGSGRRMCPAITYGTASVELALAQLLHSFDWELPPGVAVKDLDMKEVFGITMHRTEHLIVVAKPHFPLK